MNDFRAGTGVISFAVAIVALAFPGCSQKECQVDTDCPGIKVCQDHRCLDASEACKVLQCQAGLLCYRGDCYPTSCPNRICPAGFVCLDDNCTEVACQGVTCPAGEDCAGGQCFPKDCQRRTCPGYGEVCVQEECLPVSCVDVTCPADQRCANGRCYPIDCGTTPCSGFEEVCAGDECVQRTCVGVTCPAGQVCAGGNCYPGECSGGCQAGEVCYQDGCVAKDCVGVVCPQGQTCLHGACRAQGCAADSDCDDHDPCTEDHCLSGSCQNPPAQVGTACDDGLFCTDPDACQSGVCTGPARDCSDTNACTLDSCDEGNRGCLHLDNRRPDVCGDGFDNDCDGHTDPCCQGNGGFSSGTGYPVSGTSRSLAVGDFNADGIPDLAAVNFDANSVTILLGGGTDGRADGTFTSAWDVAVGTSPQAVATGDFNADRILDLAVANSGSANVSVLLGLGANGRGNAGFAPAVNYAVGDQPWAVAVGDFNADHISDLAVGNFMANTISVLTGNGSGGRGNGTFAAKVDYPTGKNPTSIEAADFNADGIQDLAVSTSGVSIHLGGGSGGRGDGTFGAGVEYATGDQPGLLAVGDFNADGILDLAAANWGSGSVSILRGNGSNGRGNGTFTANVDYPVHTEAFGVVAADFNSDHILDLAISCMNSSAVSILMGNGSGGRGDASFAAPVDFPACSGTWGIAAGRLDADASPDLAVACQQDKTIGVLLGLGGGGRWSGGFAPPAGFAAGSNPGVPAVADFDADGILDLAVGQGQSVDVYLGTGSGGRGDGGFTPGASYAIPNHAYMILAADFNHDGIQDLAAPNGNAVSILLGEGGGGRGDGTFAPRIDFPTGNTPIAITAGDFNADGILDLATANNMSGTVSILIGSGSNGLGDGTFAAKVDYPVGQQPMGLAAADFNADRILDLAVVNLISGSVSILLGNGNGGRGDGTFAPKVDYPVGTSPSWVITGDFNTDGILDLAIATDHVAILLGNGTNGRGDGTFGQAVVYQAGNLPFFVATADINGDGILDLLTANQVSNDVSLLLGGGSGGRGDGSFASPVSFPAGNGPESLVASRFNGDGLFDLLVMNYLGGTASVLLGQCQPSP